MQSIKSYLMICLFLYSFNCIAQQDTIIKYHSDSIQLKFYRKVRNELKDTVRTDSISKLLNKQRMQFRYLYNTKIDSIARLDSTAKSRLEDSTRTKVRLINSANLYSNLRPSLQIRNTSSYVSKPYSGQELPNFYNRTFLDFGFQAGFIPIKFSLQYATDNGYNGQTPGMYSISIDYQKLQQEILKRKVELNKINGINTELDSISQLIKLNTDYIDELKNKYKSENATNEVKKYRKMLEELALDSTASYKNKARFRIAKANLDRYDQKLRTLDSLEAIQKTLIQKYRVIKAIKENDYNLRKIDKSLYKQVRLNNFLSGIKNLGIGDVYPDYSALLTNGISLRGIKFDYELNNIYFGYTGGNSQNYSKKKAFEPILIKQLISCFDVGIGNKQRSYLGLVCATGNSNDSMERNEKSKDFSLAIKGGVRYEDWILLEFERAASNFPLNGSYSKYDVLRSIFSSGLNTAVKVKTIFNLFDKRTVLTLQYNQIGLYFNSCANPYLRNDYSRWSIRGDQYLAQKRWKLSLAVKSEHDNLSQTKKYTTYLFTTDAGIDWKKKNKLMKLMFQRNVMSFSLNEIAPLYTSLYTLSYSQFININGGHKIVANILYQFITSSQDNDTLKTQNHNLYINPVLLLRNNSEINLTLNRMESYSRDTSYQMLISLTYTYPYHKVRIKTGTQFRNVNDIETSYVLMGGIAYSIKKFQLGATLDYYIYTRSKMYDQQRNTMARVDLIYRF